MTKELYINLSDLFRGIMHIKDFSVKGFRDFELPKELHTSTDTHIILVDIDNTLIPSFDCFQKAKKMYISTYMKEPDLSDERFWRFYYEETKNMTPDPAVINKLHRLINYDIKKDYPNKEVYALLITGKPAYDFFVEQSYQYALYLENNNIPVFDVVLRKLSIEERNRMDKREIFLPNEIFKVNYLKISGLIPVGAFDDNIYLHFKIAEEIYENDTIWRKVKNFYHYFTYDDGSGNIKFKRIEILPEDYIRWKEQGDKYIYEFLLRVFRDESINVLNFVRKSSY